MQERLTKKNVLLILWPLNGNPIKMVGAVAAIGDAAYLKSICENVIQSRERLLGYLRSKKFKTVANSAGNFVFVSPPDGDAKGLTQRLREEGILIRHFTRPERINSWVRITVGTESDNNRLISALEDMF